MIESKFSSIQRAARAALSFYSKNNEAPNKKYNKIINFLIKFHNDKEFNNSDINKKKTHLIFSKKILELILKKKLLNFLQNSFFKKFFLFIIDYFYFFI